VLLAGGVLLAGESSRAMLASARVCCCFSHRVVSRWNMLDDNTVTAKTVHGFKSKLEKIMCKEDGSLYGLMSARLEA